MAELQGLLFPAFTAHFSGIPFYLVLMLLGMFIGFLTGFFGVGGGFLTVPLLNIVLGIPYELAVGSDLCFILGTSISGFLRQSSLGNVDYKAIICIAGGSISGTIVGDLIQDFLLETSATGHGDYFTLIMHLLFIGLLTVSVFIILKGSGKNNSGTPLLQRIAVGPSVRLTLYGTHRVNLFGMLFIGFVIGILTGIMGIGGGILLIPVLIVFIGMPADKAAGTSLGIVFLAALSGVVKKSLSAEPKINLFIVLALLVTSVIGVQIGIRAVQNIDTGKFRRYFAVVVIVTIVVIVVDLVFVRGN